MKRRLTKRQRQALFCAARYEVVCEHCRFGKPAPDGSSVLCSVRGVMRKQSACGKYEYDPLKRQPPRTPALPEYDAEQFQL